MQSRIVVTARHIRATLGPWASLAHTLDSYGGSGIVAVRPRSVRGGEQPRVLFATRAGVRPPWFVLLITGFLEAGHRRFVERRPREDFGFEGTPIEINMTIREKRPCEHRAAAGRRTRIMVTVRHAMAALGPWASSARTLDSYGQEVTPWMA